MKIQNTPYNQVAFNANYRTVMNKFLDTRLYSNESHFFRPDLDWKKFVDMLIQEYQDYDKVNICCTACSEGAEPFSLAMLLIENLGKEGAKKFFPIIASDIDSEILKNPKNGILKLSKQDLDDIRSILGQNYTKYIKHNNTFEKVPEFNETLCTGRIRPILQDTVIFKNADIKDEIPNIKKENSVFIGRNFWSYFPKEKRVSLIRKIFDTLGDNSIFVIGEFEDDIDLAKTLRKVGFSHSPLNYCFTKKNNSNHLSNPEFLMANFANRK